MLASFFAGNLLVQAAHYQFKRANQPADDQLIS